MADESAHWGLGVGAIASDNAYAGQDIRYTPIPLVTYDSKRFFFQGITAGLHIFDDDALRIDALVQGDFGGIDTDDFGRRELANNGIDRDLLEDRDDSVQAGFAVELGGRWGEIELKVLADVLDASGGFEATAEYGYPVELGDRLTVTPTLGIDWLSADSADYYYGTLDEEIARGVVRYRPGSVAIPEVGIDVEYKLGGQWLLLGNVSYELLPDEISDSPLVDSKQSMQIMIGVMRAF